MTPHELSKILLRFRLAQADLARLIEVTARGVALWLKGDRPVPGPVAAYLRLFQLLPDYLRRVELARLLEREAAVHNGMYEISFIGSGPAQTGTLIFESGKLFGGGPRGTLYDGSYVLDAEAGELDVSLKITLPPHVESIFGIQHPHEWSIDARMRFDPKFGYRRIEITTLLNTSVAAEIRFLRAVPQSR